MGMTTLMWNTFSSSCFSSTICQNVVDGRSWHWSPKQSQRWHRAETPSWKPFPSIWLVCVWFLTTCCATTPRHPCTFLNRLIAYVPHIYLFCSCFCYFIKQMHHFSILNLIPSCISHNSWVQINWICLEGQMASHINNIIYLNDAVVVVILTFLEAAWRVTLQQNNMLLQVNE